MELRDYLRITRRRWMSIVIVTLLAIGAIALFTLRVTPQYASSARLFISTPESTSDQAYTGGLFSQARVTSYADLLTGEEISRRVVDRLNLDEAPRDLAEQIKAEAKPETVVLSITVTDSSPERAQLLTQTVAEEFVLYVKELETPDGQTAAPVKASIVDRATAPDEPVSPRPVRYFGIAALLGLLVGTGVAVLRETFDTSISTPDDLTEATGGAPLLGSINFDKDAPSRPLITDLNTHAPRVESFRVLRTNLQFINVDSESKVFVVTSSVPEEGKSTTVCNLALTLSHAGEKVVVVEADLRRPKAAEYLKLEGAVGVTTVLTGRVDIDDALQSAPWGLKVIAAGSIPPNPSELLQSVAMKTLLKKLRERFDIVLIDAPPLLPVTDAAILAAASDGAILISRHGKTTRDQAAVAVGRLESVEARLVGTVANWTPARRNSFSYGYGYGDSYGYAPEAGRSKKPARSKTLAPQDGAPAKLSRKERRQQKKLQKKLPQKATVKQSRKERRQQKKLQRKQNQAPQITVDSSFPARLERNETVLEEVVKPEQRPRGRKPPAKVAPPAAVPHRDQPKGSAGNRGSRKG